MSFVKETRYEDELVDETTSGKVLVDPKLRIPFDAASMAGLEIDQEVTVTLTGKVCGIRAGKDKWDNGLEIELSDGSIKGGKSEEEKNIDSMMEGDE